MKLTEIKPLGHGAQLKGPGPDRLTQLLIWVAFFLVSALAAIAADLWIWPASDGPVAQAAEVTVLADLPRPSRTPTSLPTIEATVSPTLLAAETATPAPMTPPPCIPPDDWDIHIVQTGNTLFSLARRYGTGLETLKQVNCLNTDTIFVDQRLYVPGPLATPTVPTLAGTERPTETATPVPSATEVPVAATQSPTATPKPALAINIPAHYLNVVLLGSDKRPGSHAWRTDSMIIVSVDLESNVVRLLSIPRDLWVYIPGHGYNRINTADLWGELAREGGGPARVKQTIHHNLGIPIHYYVRVDFRGFIQIVDTVGGVVVDVDCPLSDISLTAGIHHMDGQAALRYARSRKSTNDFDRGRRQRKVLMALWDQALNLNIIPKLPSLWRNMANTFQTDLPLTQVINLAYVGVQLKPQYILSQSIGPSHVQGWITPQGASVLLPRQDKIRAMLESFYAPVSSDQLDTVGGTRVRVLNGSQRPGSEELAASTLRWDGFKVVSSGPADRQDYGQTSILVYTGNRTAAEEAAQSLRIPLTAIQDLTGDAQPPDPANPVDLEIILGQDFNPCQR
jgi:LCP family protein required for cell wall assembly